MKKILYLRTDLGARDLMAGGSVTHTLGVINGFTHAKYSVLCASSAMIPVLKKTTIYALKELKNPFPFFWCGLKINALLSNIFFFLQLMLFLRKQSIDFIYQRYSLLNCVGVLLHFLYKVPLILEYNGSEIWMEKHWAHNKRLKLTWLVRLIENINIYHADIIVVVSEPLKDELVQRGVCPKTILVNPNGVNTEQFNPARLIKERKHKRIQFNCTQKFVFGFIGTFSYWHGINILEKMIPAVVKKYPHAHFLLIGDGPLRQQLQHAMRHIKNNVTFTGTITWHNAPEYLATCDAFLVPTQPNPDGSRFFGSPTKLFEYMSMAKPIIASDLEQMQTIISPALKKTDLHKKIVPNNYTGILIDPDDYQGFIDAASFLIEASNIMRNNLGNCARAKVQNKYTWQKHVKKIEKLIICAQEEQKNECT